MTRTLARPTGPGPTNARTLTMPGAGCQIGRATVHLTKEASWQQLTGPFMCNSSWSNTRQLCRKTQGLPTVTTNLLGDQSAANYSYCTSTRPWFRRWYMHDIRCRAACMHCMLACCCEAQHAFVCGQVLWGVRTKHTGRDAPQCTTVSGRCARGTHITSQPGTTRHVVRAWG